MTKFKTNYPDAKILIIDDEPEILFSLSATLDSAGFHNVKNVQDSRQVMDTLKQDDYSCVLLDLIMPKISGKKLLPFIFQEFPGISIIILTADTEVETVVFCMRNGAYDYMAKPIERIRLLSTVEKAIQMKILNEENLNLKRGLLGKELKHPEAFDEIFTDHPLMKSIFVYIEAIADTSYPVMILGENGTGKELIARSILKLSKSHGELVAVNVAGLDDHLFSDTLFGHTRGAYTGADNERIGMIRKAENGIIFLDEIGELELSSQLKLLRLLQEQEFQVLGSDMIYKTNARFFVSTNKDLKKAVSEGKFRQDLYYRLKTHTIHLPPLRERLSDLPLLIRHFINKHAKIMGKGTPGYPPQLLDLMSHYHFPGNLRELENMIADAVTNSDNNILPLDTFLKTIEYHRPDKKDIIDSESKLYQDPKAIPTLKEVEAAHIDYVLQFTNNNLTVAAKLLGMNYSSLYRRIKRSKT